MDGNHRCFAFVMFAMICLSTSWAHAYTPNFSISPNSIHSTPYNPITADTTELFQAFEAEPSEFTPKQVMRRSMILPGWGQVTNGQVWKVPLFAGLFTGTALLTSQLTKDYHDYRAAAYNIAYGKDSDYKFGPTPSSIPESANLGQVQQLRDQTRNRRDLAIMSIVLVWGLNVVDSYVYAHMATFDVSDNLQASIYPTFSSPTLTNPTLPSSTQSIPTQSLNLSQYSPSLTFTLHIK
jgi:hypothetical protein